MDRQEDNAKGQELEDKDRKNKEEVLQFLTAKLKSLPEVRALRVQARRTARKALDMGMMHRYRAVCLCQTLVALSLSVAKALALLCSFLQALHRRWRCAAKHNKRPSSCLAFTPPLLARRYSAVTQQPPSIPPPVPLLLDPASLALAL